MFHKWPILLILFATAHCVKKPPQVPKPGHNSRQPGLTEGQKEMYVRPIAGLIFRKDPSPKAQKIALLPFRMKISSLGAAENCTKINEIEGCWRQVSIENSTGWIFDGYLASFRSPMPQKYYAQQSATYCKNVSNFCECATRIEKSEIKKYPNIVRTGNLLSLKLDSGAEAALADIKGESSARVYRFERRENDFYIFQVCCWEWSEREMVHARTGHRINTFGEQIFSPDGRFFASYNDEDFSRNGIEIFETNNGFAKRVFAMELRDLSLNKIQWKSPETIELTDPGFLNGKARHISLTNGKWKLN